MPEARSSRKPFLPRLLRCVLILTALFAGASWFYAYKLTGPRHRPIPVPADFPFSLEEAAWITADGQSIKGWFVPHEATDRALVLLHGFGGDRRSMLARASRFRQAGYAVLLYDARACGESSGNTVTFGYHEANDLLGGLAWLRERGYRRIGCIGVSLGGATVVMAADQLDNVRCVVCESVFDELAHAVDNRFRYYLRMPAAFGGCLMVPLAEQRTGVALADVKPIDRIAKLRCPVFIISGAEDVKTLPADTHRLFEAAPEPKELWMVPQAGHRDLFSPEYARRVTTFLERYMK